MLQGVNDDKNFLIQVLDGPIGGDAQLDLLLMNKEELIEDVAASA